MNILVVDDDPGMLTLLKLLLERLEHTAIPASNGQRALNHIEQATPEFIVTDLMMPDMSGQMLIQEIRQRDSHVPILVVTAVTDHHTLKKVIDYGANHVVNKPITRPILKDAIERTIQNKG